MSADAPGDDADDPLRPDESDEEFYDRNWLWLALDDVDLVAIFQTFDVAPLPRPLRASRRAALTIDDFIQESLLRRPTAGAGRIREATERDSVRPPPGGPDPEARIHFLEGSRFAAAHGFYVYLPAHGGVEPRQYYQEAWPTEPLTIDALPSDVREVAVALRVRGARFDVDYWITHAEVAALEMQPAASWWNPWGWWKR